MHARQAIVTKFLPPTNFRGSRIRAWCEAGSVTISSPMELSGVDAHAEAVRQLCAKIDKPLIAKHGERAASWTKVNWVAGGLPVNSPCGDYVFVNADTNK